MATTTFINLIKADPADNEANLGEIATSPTTGGVHVSLDIAAMLNALLWPTVLFVIFIKFHKEIPALLEAVARMSVQVGRETPLSFSSTP